MSCFGFLGCTYTAHRLTVTPFPIFWLGKADQVGVNDTILTGEIPMRKIIQMNHLDDTAYRRTD